MLNSKKQGFALVYVIMLFAVISILALGVVALSVHNTQMTKNEITQQQAYYTSKTALDSFLSAAESADNKTNTIELLKRIAPIAGANASVQSSQGINSKMGEVSITLSCDSSTEESICTKAKVVSVGIYNQKEVTSVGYINAKIGGLDLFFATMKKINGSSIMPWPIVNGQLKNPAMLPVYSKRFKKLDESTSRTAIEEMLKKNFGDFKKYPNSCVFNGITNIPGTNPVYNAAPCAINYLDQTINEGNFYFDTRVKDLAVYVGSSDLSLEMIWKQGINFHPDSKYKVYIIIDDQITKLGFAPKYNIEELPNNGGPGVVFVYLGKPEKHGSVKPVVDISLTNERNNAYFFMPYVDTQSSKKGNLNGGILAESQTEKTSELTITGKTFDGLLAELFNYVVSESESSSDGSSGIEIEVSYE